MRGARSARDDDDVFPYLRRSCGAYRVRKKCFAAKESCNLLVSILLLEALHWCGVACSAERWRVDQMRRSVMEDVVVGGGMAEEKIDDAVGKQRQRHRHHSNNIAQS